MTDLFDEDNKSNTSNENRPLADLLRPKTIEQVVGQNHLTSDTSPLGRMINSGKISSIIFWGTPGCGKTTIARILADKTEHSFEQISAIFSGIGDLKKIFEQARIRRKNGKQTMLFVDEIHRFNKSQQDAFLPVVEDGTIILIGATTENPSFVLNAALLSRCQVLVLNRLDDEALDILINRAEEKIERKLPLDDNAIATLKNMADGDGRYFLTMIEQVYNQVSGDDFIDTESLTKVIQKRAPLYDKSDDGHYNLISALHKSVRGSDVDAALYWFARMLDGGEDPKYLARRITRIAIEDIGLADPQSLQICNDAWNIYERLGSPEGELALANALIYITTAPKSNAAYKAYNRSRVLAKETGSLMPPKHILNAPTSLMKDQGYGDGYQYDPDCQDGFSGQDYFPEGIPRERIYQPIERGFEREISKRLDYWNKLREKKK